jgi:Abnormal spindle-like microcephaly-assoc'd, ASPM-SPD-2-Hydin
MRVVMTGVPILEGVRVNHAIRSQRRGLESILRAISAIAALLVILVTSGCVGVTGKGTTPAVTGASIEISPSSVSFGNVAVGQSTTKTVTLTNNGTDMLTVSGISVTGTGFTASGPHLPISLAAGQSSSISAVFKPTAGSSDTGTITIASNVDGSPSRVTLSGTGTTGATAAALTATPSSVAFGSVAVGGAETQTVRLANTGSEAVAISKITFSGNGVSVSGMTAPMTLDGGQTTNLTVTYKPVAAGTLTGSVSIASNAADPSMVIGINATATLSTLSATPSSVSFGNVAVGSDTTQTIRLQNIGTSQVTISSITPSVSGVVISGVALPANLAPGTSATLTAAYKPSGAGSVAGKITVTSNAVGSPTIIDLSGTAAAATIQLTPSATSLSFGSVNVGSSGTNQLTVRSTGNTNAKISSVAISGSGFVLGTSAAGVTLDPSQAETYTVNFDPKAAGSLSGTLTITSNAANSPMRIALAGTGVAAATADRHTVALRWDPSSSSVTGYFVYRSSKPSGPYSQLNSTPEASPSYSDGTVSSGQVYYYYVTAVDSSNIQSADSNEVSVTIPAN